MSETVDVRTVGWRNPDCEYRVMVDNGYTDWDGDWHESWEWEDKLRCEHKTINAKHDYCKTCGKTLVYP